MGGTEIESLCKRIYAKHKKALDLIYEYRPDLQGDIRQIIEKYIDDDSSLELEYSNKSSVCFAIKEWDIPYLQCGTWTTTNRLLLFLFKNYPSHLKLYLIIGPGSQPVRQQLYDMALAHKPLLNPTYKTLYPKWHSIYYSSFLTKTILDDGDIENIENEIKKHWDHFLQRDLPNIKNTITTEAWFTRLSP